MSPSADTRSFQGGSTENKGREQVERYALAPGCRVYPLDVGSRDRRFLIETGDRRWQVSAAAAAVVDSLGAGALSASELAGMLEVRLGHPVRLNAVAEQLESVLVPFGIVQRHDQLSAPAASETVKHRRYRILTFRRTLVRAPTLQVVADRLTWLFSPKGLSLGLPCLVMLGLLSLLASHQEASVTWQLAWLLRPDAVLLAVAGTFMHELGHAVACRYYGCRHGALGFGLYMTFPVLYMELDEAWRLQRMQRAVVDAGGLYFQALYVLVLLPVVALLPATWPAIAGCVALTGASMLFNANPLLRFDGYWLLSDLTGMPNLRQRGFEALRTVAVHRARQLYQLLSPRRAGASTPELRVPLPLIIYGAACAVFLVVYVVILLRVLPDALIRYPAVVTTLTSDAVVNGMAGNLAVATAGVLSIFGLTLMLAGGTLVLAQVTVRMAHWAHRLLSATSRWLRAGSGAAERPPDAGPPSLP